MVMMPTSLASRSTTEFPILNSLSAARPEVRRGRSLSIHDHAAFEFSLAYVSPAERVHIRG